jgi:hypothetical protein
VLVNFFEGAVGSNQLFESVEMTTLPRIGDLVSFRTNGDVAQFQIGWVEHIVETHTIENIDGSMDYVPSPTFVRCGLNQN